MKPKMNDSIGTINREVYRDKVLGCWTGKNIGGTLGMPFEWDQNMNDVSFYSQELNGEPTPNDDLDLQLIWLMAAEQKGIYHLNERVLGEYWLNFITGPWNEYGICKSNMVNGLTPPLSGSCNNDKWKNSNGAWIRSEIWACIFPGSPAEAALFAYYDSCCDHCGEGIYAELFTATMQSAAFVIDDIRELIKIGLAHIPADCRIAQAVKLVCEHYDRGSDFIKARQALVTDNKDMGWFQAPANIGFVIIGLLYGEGDFGKSICRAVNCGDDADCTGGAVGALLGIIKGRKAIPEQWIKPIGESIQTCSVATYNSGGFMSLPATLEELTVRVMRIAADARRENPALITISEDNTNISGRHISSFHDAASVSARVLNRSSYEFMFDLPFGTVIVDYEDGPYLTPGEKKKIILKMGDVAFVEKVISAKLMIPEDWTAVTSIECRFMVQAANISGVDIEFMPGEIKDAYCYIPLEVKVNDRFYPYLLNIPFQRKGAVNHNLPFECRNYYDSSARRKRRIGVSTW